MNRCYYFTQMKIVILIVVYISTCLADNNQLPVSSDSFQWNDNELLKIQTKFQTYISKSNDKCPWERVGDAIKSVSNKEIWKVIGDESSSANYPIMIHSSCLSLGSMGNSLSDYIESRICASLAGLHYIDVSVNIENNTFFNAFPTLVLNPNATTTMKDIHSICTCSSICHEWSSGLMHKHMSLASAIFRSAIDKYWESIDNVSKTSFRINTGSLHKMGIGNSEITKIANISSMPVIPDVSIHYRCGDNTVAHYGFLPFRAFKRLISPSARHIYVMAESKGRNSKAHHISRCDAIFDALYIYLTKHFPTATIAITRGNDFYDDLVRLTYSPQTICSISTYCLWPAIANRNEAHFPLTKLIAKEDMSFDYGKSFHWIKDRADSSVFGKHALHMSNKELVKILTD